MKLVIATLLLCACDGWDPTPEARARRVGGAQVESCILVHGGCYWKDYCLDLVEHGYCADAGVPGCSRNEPESLCT